MAPHPGSEDMPEAFRQPFPNHIVAHKPNKEIVCCFHTFVFRVAAIEDKYPGGHRAFLNKHQGWCNEHLLVIYQQGKALLKVRDDVDKYDIRKIRDWVQLDEDRVNWSWDMVNFDTRASWLKGRYKKGTVYVQYQRACRA